MAQQTRPATQEMPMLWMRAPSQEDRKTRNRLDIVDMPGIAAFQASALHILSEGLGFRKSLEQNVCLLGDDRVIPMMSYGLIEYLMGLDLSSFEVLELGGGHSTEFWAQRVRSLVTLETDSSWANTLKSKALGNVEVRATTADTITGEISALGRTFDIVVVDISGNRYRCSKAALQVLRPGGFILLDNADWYPNTTELLRRADLIQVDFHDFRPLRWYRCATSLFLHKEFRARPRHGRLPLPLIGGKDIADANQWDIVTD
jgi:hypothetical protein